MATYSATAHTTFLGGFDMTGTSNQTETSFEWEPLECTVFGNTARNRLAGLEDVQSSVNGYFDAAVGAVDPTLFANHTAGSVQVVTQTPTGTELDVAYMYQVRQFNYQMFGEIGQVVPYTLSMQGAKGNGTAGAGAVRGRLLKAKGNISSTGATGQVSQLGLVGTGQYLYCAVHCFSVGTTFTLQIQSDDSAGMGTPTTRMTVGPITSTGGTWGTRVAGPIATDTHWRVNVSALTGTSQIAVAVGIK